MNWYKIAMDSKLQKIQDFLESLNDIEYGWMGTDGKKHNDPNENPNKNGNIWWNTYKVMTPEEVQKHKIGTCIDLSILEQEWFKENLPNVKTKIIWIQQFSVAQITHHLLKYGELLKKI